MAKNPELPFEAQQFKYISADFIPDEEFRHPQGSPIEEIDYIYPDDYENNLQTRRAIMDQPNTITVSTNPERRARREAEKLKIKESVKKFPDGNPDARREDFGPGKHGDAVFQIIKNGEECLAFIGENHEICGNLSIGTIDMDASGHLDHFPHCSEKHAQLLIQQLGKDRHKDSSNTMARNGNARNWTGSQEYTSDVDL